MSDSNIPPPLGYVSDPLQPHRVVVEFDVLARSQAEADHIVGEVLVEELAGEPEDIRTDGARVFAEDFGDDVASIRSWEPLDVASVPPKVMAVPSVEWEPLEDSGIPEIVARMFPPEPQTAAFRLPDGTADTEGFDEAHEQWRETCLHLAYAAARLPETLARVEVLEQAQQRAGRAAGAERVRDAVIDLLERDPLPVEPVKDDYLVTVAPAFEDEYEDMRYAWDHSQWRTEFTAAALRREHVLRELISDGGPRTSYLPAQFSRTWMPADLAAIHTLRGLVDIDESGLGIVPLAREVRDRVEAMLAAADPDIRVADPDDPERGELFAGLASDAHDWVPAGVYAATGIDGEGDFRLIVGPVPGTAGATASAAFPHAEHDSAVLNGIAWILEQHTEQQPPAEVLRQVNDRVISTGRTGALVTDLGHAEPMTRLERGVLLSEFLAEREQQLDPGPDDPERPSPDAGLGRNL